MLQLDNYRRYQHLFVPPSTRPSIAGISGGATSGVMAALLSGSTLMSFQNTGKEHPRTYDFLEALADAVGREIVWLEYRPPAVSGSPPSTSRFAVVTPRTADRGGGPFEMLMRAINEYRAAIGKGAIAPWWRSRICTTYMKTRLARRFVESLGWDQHDELVGLRADEPDRVRRLRVGVPGRIGRHAPLSQAGFTIDDIASFWREQSFRLDLPPHLGNCTGCFLKDQTDLSRSLEECGDVDYWASLQDRYPGFGGRRHAGYRRLAAEAPARREIEAALASGSVPSNHHGLDPGRFRLVVIQERKRLAGQVAAFSCNCEGSDALSRMDDDEENTYIAQLPGEEDAA